MRALAVVFLVACGGTTTRTPAPPSPQALSTAARARSAPAADVDDVIAAQVGAWLITVREVDRAVDAEVKPLLDKIADPALRRYHRQRERLRVLGPMIENRLLRPVAVGVEVSDAEVERAYDLVRAQTGATTSQFEEAIRATGITVEDYRAQVREELAIARGLQRLVPGEPLDVARARLVGELRARTKITIVLRPPVPPPNAPRLLDASALLARVDLEQLLGRTLPASSAQRLGHEPRSATFDSLHLRADAPHGESHDVAVRVWKDARAALDATWARVHSGLQPAARIVDRVGDTSFEVTQAGIHGHVFLDHTAGVVVMVSCGALVCAGRDDALAIAKLVHERLGRLTTSPQALR